MSRLQHWWNVCKRAGERSCLWHWALGHWCLIQSSQTLLGKGQPRVSMLAVQRGWDTLRSCHWAPPGAALPQAIAQWHCPFLSRYFDECLTLDPANVQGNKSHYPKATNYKHKHLCHQPWNFFVPCDNKIDPMHWKEQCRNTRKLGIFFSQQYSESLCRKRLKYLVNHTLITKPSVENFKDIPMKTFTVIQKHIIHNFKPFTSRT